MAYGRPVGPALVAPDRVGMMIDEVSGDLIIRAPAGLAIRLLDPLDATYGSFDQGVWSGVDVQTVSDVLAGRHVRAQGASSDVSAGRDVTAGRNVTAAQDVAATRDVTAGQNVTAATGVTGSTVVGSTSVRGGSLYAGPSTSTRYQVYPGGKTGQINQNTNGSGQITVAHNIGTNSHVSLTMRWPTVMSVGNSDLQWRVMNETPSGTTFQFTFGNTPVASYPINATWEAHPL